MGLHSDTVFSAIIVAVTLMLTPCPVHLAPTQIDPVRETREVPLISNEALAAFNGLSITTILLSHHPNFSTTDQSASSGVRDNMCDLLAYHNILVTSVQDDENNSSNTTSSSHAGNTTEEDPVTVLLRANIQNTCVWLKQMHNENEADCITISGEEETGLLPASCDLEVLGLYCAMQRLVTVVQSARTAVQESIYETYNDGEMTPINIRYREWIDNNVPELISQLQMFYF